MADIPKTGIDNPNTTKFDNVVEHTLHNLGHVHSNFYEQQLLKFGNSAIIHHFFACEIGLLKIPCRRCFRV